jgi:hypothetical protein
MLLRSVGSLRDIGQKVIEKVSLKNAKSVDVLNAKVSQLRDALARCETDLKQAIADNNPETVGIFTLEKVTIYKALVETLELQKSQLQLEEFKRLKQKACNDPGLTSVGAFLWVFLVRYAYWVSCYPKWPCTLLLVAWVFHYEVIESGHPILGLLVAALIIIDFFPRKMSGVQALIVLCWFARMHYWMCSHAHIGWNVFGVASASLLFCRVCYDHARRAVE